MMSSMHESGLVKQNTKYVPIAANAHKHLFDKHAAIWTSNDIIAGNGRVLGVKCILYRYLKVNTEKTLG